MTNDNTRIEWSDATWNPVTGCSKVSAGCVNCYAEAVSTRFHLTVKPWTFPNAGENVQMRPERLAAPLKWKRPRRIFVNSMSDLFHENVPVSYVATVFAVMAATPRHTFQVLTKRPERMATILAAPDFHYKVKASVADHPELFAGLEVPVPSPDGSWPNIWLGTSVEDDRVRHRIVTLHETPAALRFLSCEPLIGPLDLNYYVSLVDWVIVGGESGPNYRPMEMAWLDGVAAPCIASGVPLFVKQDSGQWPGNQGRIGGELWQHKEMPKSRNG